MEELADLLNAESQLIEALPKMADSSRLQALKTALEDCLKITREHVTRLQDIFSNIGQNPQRLTCKAMKGLIRKEAVNKTEKGPAGDTAIIDVAQRVQQYEISRYKTVREHAADLGHTRIVELFTKTLNEKRAMNFHFNELAQGMINAQAIDPESSGQRKAQRGFYVREGKFKRGGIKKKIKDTDISRFISEGNPNVQNPEGKEEEKGD
jgi:ferritin-like metal-binding protein YciE